MLKNNKKIINAWAMFDWANSAYSLVISTAIFPTYFENIYKEGIVFSGKSISGSSLFSFAVTISYLLMAFLSPILSGIADYGGKKKMFLSFFTTLGAFGCASLWWFDDTMRWVGIVGFVIATIGWLGSAVFYNSYLPEIATEDQYDQVSAKGFALGYIGSVLLLIVNLIMVTFYDKLGFASKTQAVTLSFLSVGFWWFGFAQITLRRLEETVSSQPITNMISKGFEEIKKVWAQIKDMPNLKRFLMAFFCYNGGVQTVIYMATIFAANVLNFETTQLIITVLILQIVGIAGAYLFAAISDKKGNVFALSITLLIWIFVCIVAYFVNDANQFYAVGGLVGLVMGGVQSLSRATYSKLVPKNSAENTSFFSFYDVVDKVSVVAGTLVFGIINNVTGDMRMSALSLAVFFILGVLLLKKVSINHQYKTN
jgi:MFS transporter, UMF1 family